MNSAVLEPRVSKTVVVREFTDADATRWDDYVLRHPEAGFFHRADWRTVIKEAFGHRPYYLLAECDGELCGVLPLFHQRSLLFGNALISLPFGVYGGVVADDKSTIDALGARAFAMASELGASYLELRHTDRLFPQWPAKDLYVTFRKTISASDEENLSAVPRKQRAMIRKGLKAGMEVTLDTDVDTVYDLYSESVRNLGTPVFSRRYFEILLDTFPSETEIIVLSKDARPVSAVMSFYHRNTVLPYYGGGTVEARALSANDLMYWEVMKQAVARGISIFDYGRSKVGTGSYRFKKHWGFEPQPLHYEYGLVGGHEMPDLSPANPKYRFFIAAWKKLPLPLSRLLGPMLSKNLG